jgi:hypothetical protein
MRAIKELLEVMLNNQEMFYIGLCHWVYDLNANNIIHDEEAKKLYKYIDTNRPHSFSSIEAYKNRNNSFFWNKGNIKPRIKWIQKHIKINS